MSEFPTFTIRQLLDAGVHFGHKTMRWNPKMAPYLYGDRDGIHIIDLQQTVPMLYQALQLISDIVKNNGRVLFVGTKRQASDIVAEAAKRCGQYYVNHRWLGGMLTNWNTISLSIRTLKTMEERIAQEHVSAGSSRLTKKELLELERKAEKLQRSLGGIRDMGGKPDLLFVIDTNKEDLAVKEAKKLGIPIIGIVDSNSDPDDIDYPVPGNDDATRAIKLYCKYASDAALHGIQQAMITSGADIGAAADIDAGNEEGSDDAATNTSAEGEASAKKTIAKKATSKPKAEKAEKVTTKKATSSKKAAVIDTAETAAVEEVHPVLEHSGEDAPVQKASNS